MKKSVSKGARGAFNKIVEDIKNVKIQGAESVAISGVKAYAIIPTKESIIKLNKLRATEPALENSLKYAKKNSPSDVIKHFKDSKEITNNLLEKKILKNGTKVFTHCHSSRVVDGIIKAHINGKKIEVFNTETRPLYQGRKTARELSNEGIRVTTFVDAAARSYVKDSNIILMGADAILSNGDVINKIGSNMFAEIAKKVFKKKVYIVTDSWKFSKKNVQIEERNFEEIWKVMNKKLKIKNPAFERVEAKYISAIVSELGILSPKKFVKEVRKRHPWI